MHFLSVTKNIVVHLFSLSRGTQVIFIKTLIIVTQHKLYVLHSPHDSSDDDSYTSLFTEWLKQCSKLKKITYVPFKNCL